MRADELLVQRFLGLEQRVAQLEETNHYLREDNRELERKYKFIKSLFYLEEDEDGYKVGIKGIGYCANSSVAYEFTKDPNDMDQEFLELLDALSLVLPTPEQEGLENDPELVAQALEKAKELQKEKNDQ